MYNQGTIVQSVNDRREKKKTEDEKEIVHG